MIIRNFLIIIPSILMCLSILLYSTIFKINSTLANWLGSFSIVGLIFIGVCFMFFDVLYVINDTENNYFFFQNKKYYTLGNSYKFQYANGVSQNINVSRDYTIINNTNDTLVYEDVEFRSKYAAPLETNSDNIIIPPESYSQAKEVNYLFEFPPLSIKENKSTSGSTKGWLHTK
jgi:hypothetical protein